MSAALTHRQKTAIATMMFLHVFLLQECIVAPLRCGAHIRRLLPWFLHQGCIIAL